MKIAKVIGREIYDARGLPTVECEISLEDGSYVSASVPTGISRGKHEAHEIRSDSKSVIQAVDNIESLIAPLIIGKEPNVVSMDIDMIELDGTVNKAKLGANAMLAVSSAVLRAQASVENMEVYELVGYLCEYNAVSLPLAMFNCISGGQHAFGNVRIQEMMVIPMGGQNFRQCLDAATQLHHYLQILLQKNFDFVAVTTSGGLTADFEDDAQALEMLMEAIEAVQKTTQYKFLIALDVAASQFYDRKTNKYDWYGKNLVGDDLIDLYHRLIKQYPIFSIEDGLSEFDEKGWKKMTEQLSDKVQILGDDLFASNPNHIANGIEQQLATGALIKPTQIGTLTEALQAIKLCKEYEMLCVLSGRGAETNDTIIVDLAVGTSAGYIKAGGPSRGEHLAKYNDILRIEDTLMLSLME